ncbi:hypothetical protein DSUL_60210 [Desulfovibrionales bacterium]
MDRIFHDIANYKKTIVTIVERGQAQNLTKLLIKMSLSLAFPICVC